MMSALEEPPAIALGRQSQPRRGAVFLMVALALMAACLPGMFTEYGRYLLPGRLFDHPMTFGTAAWLLGGYGLAQFARQPLARAGLIALGTVLGLLWVPLVAYMSLFTGDEQQRVANEEETLDVVVLRGGIIDPVWEIRIEQTDRGLRNQWSTVGCVDGNRQTLEGVRWTDGALVIDSSAGSVALTLDASAKTTAQHTVHAKTLDQTADGPILGAC